VIDGIDYLHQRGIAHRDIKLENIFLTETAEVKIADFGLNKIFEGEDAEVLKTKCGTPNYMAPEMLNLTAG
jgi:serine/threonine protein kinase